MNNDFNNFGIDTELSPRESAAIDSIMKHAADRENGEVDYNAMLASIKRRAADEGIVVFPAGRKAKKESIWKRIALGAATAAAVFVVGLSVLFVLDSLSSGGQSSNHSSAEAFVSGEPSGSKQGSSPSITALSTKAPSPGIKKETSSPNEVESAHSAAPVSRETDSAESPELSPFPTEFTMRGGSAGYLDLSSFENEPDNADDLVPADLPSCMVVMPQVDDLPESPNLSVQAAGESDGKTYSYTCMSVSDLVVDLDVGVAMYKYDEESGHITYIWRISEDTFLVVDFDGFDLESAEELLSSLTNDSIRIDATPAA